MRRTAAGHPLRDRKIETGHRFLGERVEVGNLRRFERRSTPRVIETA
jgi:hypothetical protein